MAPLDPCIQLFDLRRNHRLRVGLLQWTTGLLLTAGAFCSPGVRAQTPAAAPTPAPAATPVPGAVAATAAAPAPAPAPPAINFRERPKYPTDPQRLRRTVQIDGVISDNEWDPFYTITDGQIRGTVYCNWDDNYLYLAARTEHPATVLFDVDTGGDGWLRGADNLEVVVGSVASGGTPTVVARVLDAANSKDTPYWNDKASDPSRIVVGEKITGDVQVLEIAIPKNTASLVLRPGATIGVRAEFMAPGPASSYVPTQPFEPHLLLDAKLVDSRVEAAAGVNPRLTLSDNKCIAGETLFATLALLNQTDQHMKIRRVSWSGIGNSTNAVNSLREIAVPPLKPQSTWKRTYHTLLPVDLTPGSYGLNVVVDLEGGKQVESTATFAVVEPLQVEISSNPQPVAVLGPTKVSVDIDVLSAVPNGTHCDATIISSPDGWEIQGGRLQKVAIDRKDGRHVSHFIFKIPSTTPAGDYPISATVTWRGREWRLHHVVQVIRTDEPKAAAPAPKAPGQ